MPRKVIKTQGELYAELRQLVLNFENYLERKELRPKVLQLVEVLYKYRELGITLVDPEHSLSAKKRILRYFQQFSQTVISGDELLVISGIQEYARRIRELRVELGWPVISGVTAKQMILEGELPGYDLNEIKVDSYILLQNSQDKETAFRYNLMKDLRKNNDLSGRDKMLSFLRQSVGSAITGEELSYVSKISDWPRRMRELRTEYGWPIMTKNTGRPDLPVGYYVLVEDRQDRVHDRKIKTEDRVKALDRDGGQCVKCGWPVNRFEGDTIRNCLELHHFEHHAKGGKNTFDNLITLCNVHHDEIHRKDKNNSWSKETFLQWVNE